MPYKKFIPEVFRTGEALAVTGKAQQDTLGPALRVLVWNIYKAARRNWSGQFERLSASHDLMLLQESVLNTRHDPLFSGGRFEWIMARSYKSRRSGARETGVKTGALAPAHARAFFHSPDTEPLLKTPKTLLATTYNLSKGGRLLVLNMHAINFVSLEKYGRHLDQIAEAARHHDGPVILGGDFNTWSAARFTRFHDTLEKLGLKEAALTRKPRLRHLYRHLDHVFYRDLTLREARVISGTRASDHDPLSLVFTAE